MSDSEGVNVLSESIHNVLFNDAPLKNSQKRRIRKEYSKDKKVLLEISNRRGSFKNRKKLLKQSGGYLGTLLGITKLTCFKENQFWYIISFPGIAASLLMPMIFGNK